MSTETLPVVEEKPHHDYSPSTLQYLEACPCYQGKQSATPHPRTIIGQISHAVTETGEDNPQLSDEDTVKAAECIDFYETRKEWFIADRAKAVQKNAVERWGTRVAPGEEEDAEKAAEAEIAQILEIKETYLPVDDEFFIDSPSGPFGNGTLRRVHSTTAGYIDSALISWCRTYAEIFDWKFGLWPVEDAENNLQGIAYALGLFKRFPSLQKIKYWFKQPNLDYVTHATIERKDIPEHYLRVQVTVARAREARNSGDFQTARALVPACNFCRHIGLCPVVTGFACRTGSKFYPLEIPADITPSRVHNPHDTRLGLQLASVLEIWAKAFKGVITNRVLCQGVPPPEGYDLESRSPRNIVDHEKYKQTALKYLTDEEYAATLKPSLGKVEEKISEKTPRGQKEAAVKKFAEEADEVGATVRGDSYTFLKAKPVKPKK